MSSLSCKRGLLAGILVVLLVCFWPCDREPQPLSQREPAVVAVPPTPPSSPSHSSGSAAFTPRRDGGNTAADVPQDRLHAHRPFQSIDPLNVAPAALPADPVFDRFDAWLGSVLGENPLPESVEQGVALAQARRNRMEELIRRDPKQALQRAVDSLARAQAPAPVAALLEEVFDARGDLEVIASISDPVQGSPQAVLSTRRWLQWQDQTWEAQVFGRRLEDSSAYGVSLHGILLGRLAAVDERALRPLSLAESASVSATLGADPVCSVSEQPLAPADASVLVMDAEEPRWVCGTGHQTVLEQAVESEDAASTARTLGKATLASTAWTTGDKKLLMIRVDFSDLTGAPFGDQDGTNMVVELNDFYRSNSYGKMGFLLLGAGSKMTPTLRMPSTAAFYGGNDNASKLRSDARAAAKAAGYDPALFNLDLVCMGNVPGFGWAGLGAVGGAGAWIRGTSSPGVAAHELGHNLGLNHANFWDTGGASVIGAGESVEYGDKFDTMGSAAAGVKHFNARYKNYLGWLPSSDVATANGSGRFRILPHDGGVLTGIRALKAPMNSSTNYWVEFRQRYTSNRWLMDGVSLRWGKSGNQSTLLLDLTPGSADGKDDAVLLPGQTFSDVAAGLHITVIGKAGTAPEAMDLAVYRGSFPSNHAPEVSGLGSTAQTFVNSALRLSVTASDPDGDELAYAWDFGDRNYGQNRAEVTHQWAASGDYLVRCTVSDMRGGTTVKTLVVRVGNPSTLRVTGKVTKDGQPMAGVLVSLGSSKTALTDSDGVYRLLGVTSGSYTLKARLDGYAFLLDRFTSPLQLTASIDGADFHAVSEAEQGEVALIRAGAEWRYLDDGSNQGSAWTGLSFNDAAWKKGAAELGYGDKDVTTTIDFGPNSNNKYVTSYFRRSFTVDDPASIVGLSVDLVRDDGAVVYLNGRELFRSNMPTGTVNYTTKAASTVNGDAETAWFENIVDPALLRKGSNVIAVEVHQSSVTSSDVHFDLRMTGTTIRTAVPPALGIRRVESGLQVVWPVGDPSFKLYASPRLGPAAQWVPLDGFRVVDGQNILDRPLGDTGEFLQLRK